MKIINKIAILISWPREIDMLSVFIKDEDFLCVIIVDDMIYSERERSKNSLNIIRLLEEKSLEYIFLSDVLNKYKYKVLISTAQSFQEYVTVKSYIKYIYAQSIGRLFDLIKLSYFFSKYLSRPLNGGGIKSKKFKFRQIERLLGETVVKFPKGLDVSLALYPNERWRNFFDLYLCHSSIDYNLIREKFNNSKCVKIGYPRYEKDTNLYKDPYKIVFFEDKEIDRTKRTVLWVPAHIKIKSEAASNIRLWLPLVKKLIKKYNIIIRPHPKTLITNPEIVEFLKASGLIIDLEYDREMRVLYSVSDLILADYGGSVLDLVYMKKKCILLNMPKNSKFFKWRVQGEYIDKILRDDIYSIDYDKNINILKQVSKEIVCENLETRKKIKYKYFGSKESCMKMEDLKSELIGHLSI